MAIGGTTGPGNAVTTATEEYNGSSWTSNPTGLNSGRGNLGGCGTQTAALVFGGLLTAPAPGTGIALTEEYNGSTWAVASTLATARYFIGGTGIQTAALAMGGRQSPGALGNTEEYVPAAAVKTLTTS